MPRILISEPDSTPQPYKINANRMLIKIGRGSANDLPLTHGSTSTNHCVIRKVQGGYILEDNGSTNGVKIDNLTYQKIDLNQDTQLQLGDVDVTVTFTDEELSILASEDTFKSEQILTAPKNSEKANSEKTDKKKTPKLEKTQQPDPQQFVVSSGQNSPLKSFLLLILCILGFFGGLSAKHFQETNGRFLHDDILGEKAELPDKEGNSKEE